METDENCLIERLQEILDEFRALNKILAKMEAGHRPDWMDYDVQDYKPITLPKKGATS